MLIRSVFAALSTFSKIPVPTAKLDEKDYRYALCFFPIVGVVIALLEWCAWMICRAYELNDILRICLMCVIPVLVTGGIHLDGFCDTSDAKSSYQPMEKKLEILKDPHIGAFGVIKLVALTLLYAAAVSEIENVVLIGTTFVISRSFSAISVVTLKSAKKTGMGAVEKENSDRAAVCISSCVWLVICGVVAFTLSGVMGLIALVVMVVVSILALFLYMKDVYRTFGGFTGDTSGWFLCVLEVILAYACVVMGFFMHNGA